MKKIVKTKIELEFNSTEAQAWKIIDRVAAVLVNNVEMRVEMVKLSDHEVVKQKRVSGKDIRKHPVSRFFKNTKVSESVSPQRYEFDEIRRSMQEHQRTCRCARQNRHDK